MKVNVYGEDDNLGDEDFDTFSFVKPELVKTIQLS